MENKQSCKTCYKIICKQCKWEADDDAVMQIQSGKITACPVCGWSPSDIL